MFLPFYTIQTVAVSPRNLKLVQKLVRSIVRINAFNFHNESNNRFYQTSYMRSDFLKSYSLLEISQPVKEENLAQDSFH